MTPTTRDAEVSLLIVSLTKEAYPFLTKKKHLKCLSMHIVLHPGYSARLFSLLHHSVPLTARHTSQPPRSWCWSAKRRKPLGRFTPLLQDRDIRTHRDVAKEAVAVRGAVASLVACHLFVRFGVSPSCVGMWVRTIAVAVTSLVARAAAVAAAAHGAGLVAVASRVAIAGGVAVTVAIAVLLGGVACEPSVLVENCD